MRRLVLGLALLCFLGLAGCSRNGVLDKGELGTLVEEEGYTEEQVLEKLAGKSWEDMEKAWGEPDGMLSGFWGNVWHFGEGDGWMVVVYYDRDGLVQDVRIGVREL